MSALSAWILSILGIVVIGAVIDLVLPSGRMNKYVKSVFAAVTVLVIILPLPNMLKNGCDSENFIFNEQIQLQEDYLGYAEKVKRDSIVRGLRSALASDGITIGEVEIVGKFSAAVPIVEEVRINLSQVVISGQTEHINKCEVVRSKVSEYLSIDKESIQIYER